MTQFRLKDRKWENSNAWIQGMSYPELEEDGSIKSIMGTLVDISQFKWAENVQKLRTEEALEAKRQQENFIDMTSHEMRNPLSAVVQCADSTVTSLMDMLTLVSDMSTGEHPMTENDRILDSMRKEIQSSLDAVSTIVSCSSHQKRIIDDVLTLSKLDSSLLLITPIKVDPVVVVSEVLKMFEVECHKATIDLVFTPDPSLKETIGNSWVMLDPSRLTQILINLLTSKARQLRWKIERLSTTV